MKLKKSFLITYISGLIGIPIVLLILPADFFDTGPSICLSVLLFDQPCYGCGMTRAVQHLVHLDINGAWGYNRLSMIVAPLLVFLWIQEIIRIKNKLKSA